MHPTDVFYLARASYDDKPNMGADWVTPSEYLVQFIKNIVQTMDVVDDLPEGVRDITDIDFRGSSSK